MSHSTANIETIQLRDVLVADLEVFYDFENDAEAIRRAEFPARPYDAFIRHWELRLLIHPDPFVKTVLVDEDVAGHVVSWTHLRNRMIGYWFGRQYWGRGIGSRAVAAFLQEETRRPIYADPVSTNTGSVKLLEKLGFTQARSERRPSLLTHSPIEHSIYVLGERE